MLFPSSHRMQVEHCLHSREIYVCLFLDCFVIACVSMCALACACTASVCMCVCVTPLSVTHIQVSLLNLGSNVCMSLSKANSIVKKPSL